MQYMGPPACSWFNCTATLPVCTVLSPLAAAHTATTALSSASRPQSSLFRPLDVFANALVNSATVEERAVREELQRQTLLFSDQVLKGGPLRRDWALWGCHGYWHESCGQPRPACA